MRVKIGMEVVRQPEGCQHVEYKDGQRTITRAKGRVVYIHPQGRYHTVEFVFPFGKWQESFPGVKA